MKKISFGLRFTFLIALSAVALLAAWAVVLAFRGEITVPSSLDIGGFRLRIYSLVLLLAVLAGYLAGRKYFNGGILKPSEWENLILLDLLAGILGARIHHVLSDWSYYSQRPLEIFLTWRGGLGFFGGLIGACLATYWYSRRKKIGFFELADRLSLALPLAHAIGRWGNFFNQEAYGWPTSLPWKMYVAPENRLGNYFQFDFFHPVFLYESLWNLLVFLLLRQFAKFGYLKNPGKIFGWYLVLYAAGRFFIEGLRADVSL
ncbi:MAG: prolipoprotein diacylglyceryl transferase, partial [bacterium]|nr:prolipoprotein diacylglyceryl transferase [bacterium]